MKTRGIDTEFLRKADVSQIKSAMKSEMAQLTVWTVNGWSRRISFRERIRGWLKLS